MSDAEKVVAELRRWSPFESPRSAAILDRAADLIAHLAARLEEADGRHANVLSAYDAAAADAARLEDANTALRRVIEDCEAALTAAEAEVGRLRSGLEPFSKAAEDCGVEDDLRIGVVKPADIIWESAAAVSITFGHLETARACLSSKKEG